MSERITQAEFARQQNVTRQTINEWVMRGIILLDESKLLDPDQALAAIAAARDPARQGKIISGPQPSMTPAEVTTPPPAETKGQGDLPTTDEATSFHAARTRRELAMAQLAEIELAEKRGQLLPADLLIQIVARAAPRACGILDAIVPALRRRSGYSADDLGYITEQIAQARNAIAAMTYESVMSDQSADTQETREDSDGRA